MHLNNCHCSYFSLKSGSGNGKEKNGMELGLAKLKQLLAVKQARVRMRYNYYTMKNVREHLSSMIPASFQSMVTCLGWCAKSVDSLADRIVLDTFEQDDFGIGEIYRLNNADVLFDSAILSALIASCSFLYIGRNENGYPSIQVVDGYHATGTIDPTTNLLTEGYAILERDEWERPVLEAYFQPHRTVYYREGRHSQTFTHKAPYAALVPVIHRPDASRPFGHSRISRSCMALTQSALRTLVRSEVSAEFYSFPQKYV
jgi:hypothetical protein